MRYLSTFLSHSSADKPLVEAVLVELGRRGIVAWLDKHELVSGGTLSQAISEAIKQQATVAVFLSDNAVTSDWVNDELTEALKVHADVDIIPVYLGDCRKLIARHPLLKQLWMHADGKRVDKLGIISNDRDPVSKIASEISAVIYNSLRLAQCPAVSIYLDQRGDGGRRTSEITSLPGNLGLPNAPMFVFRHDDGLRTPGEILDGEEWRRYWTGIKNSLGHALGSSRTAAPKELHLLGGAQLALPFFLGKLFNRSTNIHWYCHDVRSGGLFSNANQPRTSPLTGGNPQCETAYPTITGVSNSTMPTFSLLLLKEAYIADVLNYLAATGTTEPSVWVAHGNFNTDGQVWDYLKDVIALIQRLRKENGLTSIRLFTSLPFHVLPLLGANLLHVVEDITFMELHRSKQGPERYVALQDG